MLHPPATPTIESAADALAVTLHELGHVDIDRIADLLGRSRDEALAELGDRVFLDPQTTIEGFESWQTADAYLSGPVRTKLAAAIAAAARDARYRRNVEALGPVQPEDLKPSDISARLGAPWIPTADVIAFVTEVIGVKASIHHTVEIASWTVELSAFAGRAEATSEWGTARRNAGLLLGDALNSVDPADLRRLEGGRQRAARAERRRDRGGQGEARQDQDRFRALGLDRCRADRASRPHLQRPVQQSGPAALRRRPSAASRREQRHQILRPPEARHLAHRQRRARPISPIRSAPERPSPSPPPSWSRSGSASIAKAMLVVPGHCLAQASREFLAALSERPHSGRRRDQFLQGQAPALPRPRRHGAVGLHHHHPPRLQIRAGARRLRAGADSGPARQLFRICSRRSTATTASRASASSA